MADPDDSGDTIQLSEAAEAALKETDSVMEKVTD